MVVGETEVSCPLNPAEKPDNSPFSDQIAIMAFSEALEVIPISLDENNGYRSLKFPLVYLQVSDY